MDTVQSYLRENPVEVRGLTGIMDPNEINRTYNEMHRNAYRSGGFVSPTRGVTVEDEDLDLPPAEYLEKLNDEVYSTVGPSAFDTEDSNYDKDTFAYVASQTPLSHTMRRDSLNRRMVGYGFNLDNDENFALAAGVLNLKPEEVEEIRSGEVAISTAQARSLYEAQVKRADKLISERTDAAPLRANQRTVLTAMAIHNPELIGPDLVKAIKNGDADGAINEIRNRSNAAGSRELRIRRVQDAQHFSNYMPEGEVADEELGVRMGIRPKARPTSAPETSLRPQARPTSAPTTSLRPQARPETAASDKPNRQGYIPPTMGATELNTPAVRNALAGPSSPEEQGMGTSLRPQARPTYAPETSLRPQARAAIAKDEAVANPNPINLEELAEQGMQTARDAFGGIAARAYAGYNSAVERVIEAAGGVADAAVHFYSALDYREAAAAGQVEPGTDIVIGEDTGNGRNDYTAFTHIDGDSAPAIASEETPEFYEALARRPGLRMGEPVNISLVEDGILDNTLEIAKQLPESFSTFSKNVREDVAEIATSLVSKTSEVSDAAIGKAASVFEAFNETMDDVSFREYTSFISNFVNPGRTITETDLGDAEVNSMRELIASAKAAGRNFVDYTDMGSSEAESIDAPGLFGGITNPMVRVQRVVGGFQFSENEQGETIVRNTYNFNGNPQKNKSRVQFYEAYKEGDYETMGDIAYRLRFQPVSFASVLGYVRQEELKASGKPHETEMVINLGVIN